MNFLINKKTVLLLLVFFACTSNLFAMQANDKPASAASKKVETVDKRSTLANAIPKLINNEAVKLVGWLSLMISVVGIAFKIEQAAVAYVPDSKFYERY